MKHYGLEWHSLDTYLQFKESSTPTTPEPNEIRQYASDSGGISTMCWKNDAGGVICLPTATGTLPSGSGAAGQVAFWTSATNLSGENALFWDATNNRLGIGTATPLAPLHIQIEGSELARARLQAFSGGASSPDPDLLFIGLRGTVASPTAVQADDRLGNISWQGRGATTISGTRALLRARAAENWTDSAQGTYISLETTPTGSATRAERFRIGPAGQWGIGGATFGGIGDIFSSSGASAAPTWVTRATLNAALDHGLLAGLADDDHTQYALLAGRSGGQTLKGGTASGDDLTLQSTNHATKGNIFLGTSETVIINNTQNNTDQLAIENNSDSHNIFGLYGYGVNANFQIQVFQDAATGPTCIAYKFRGTSIASVASPQSGDTIFNFVGRGYTNTFSGDQVQFQFQAAQNWGAGAAGTKILFATTPNGSVTLATRMVIDQSGFVGIGVESPPSKLTVADTSSGASRGIEGEQFSADVAAAQVALKKTRGASVGAFSAVQSGDNLGAINFYGSDGAAFNSNSSVQARATASETHSSTAQGAQFEITTTPNGAAVSTSRFLIMQDGAIEATVNAYHRLMERSTTPGNPADGTEIQFYMRANKFILQYNDAGTVRYKYLDMTGTGVTWVHTTTAPT